MIEIKFKRVHNRPTPLPLPRYQSELAAGIDLHADIEAPIILEVGQRQLIPTGIAVEIPKGYEAQIRPRSGLAIKWGLSLVNSPGTIDADYRGEIQVIMINHGDKPAQIERGDRIAQMVFSPVVRVQIKEVTQLNGTERSQGGFGSTGVSHG